jgi:UDP-glucose 4-epimerase
MNKNNRNILVTGGAGYIGSKISIDLLRKGYQVFVVDNLQTGFRFLLDKKVNFFKIDIRDEKKISHILKKNKINNIIHLAASLSVEERTSIGEANYLKYKQYSTDLYCKKMINIYNETDLINV